MKTVQIIDCTGRNITFQCNDQRYMFSKVDSIRKLLDSVGGKRAYLCGHLLFETQSMCVITGEYPIYVANKRAHDQQILLNQCTSSNVAIALLEQYTLDLDVLGTGNLHKCMKKLRKHILMNMDYLAFIVSK